MKVKDLIWKLEQIYDKNKEIKLGKIGENPRDGKALSNVVEGEFYVSIR